MQDALRILSDYWTSRGCLTWQPYNSEVGAGTMNPATVLRVLGPEPWDVAYVEPSVRPDDSRYGENPMRIQTFTQFQVILKPEPGDPQELYLGSLEALGIDLDAHDVAATVAFLFLAGSPPRRHRLPVFLPEHRSLDPTAPW